MQTSNQNTKNALCYIPLVAFILYFIEDKKTEEFSKHLRYGMVLFTIYFILSILISWLFVGTLFLLYIGYSAYLGYSTYSGKNINIVLIDNFFEKYIKNDSKKKSEKENKDDDILNF